MMRKICLIILVLHSALLPINNVCWSATGLWIEENTPAHNSLVENLELVLKVTVFENDKPLPYAWIHFYIDDERIDSCFIGNDGVASLYIGELEEHGYHKWQVKVDKPGNDPYWSSLWRFNYQPRPVLTLYSKHGEAFGEGNYTYGETVNFGLESPIIEISEGMRLVFTGWQSNQEYGYTGSDYTNNVKMLENIREIASWKTQFYLNTSSELSKFVYPKSGWYDEGKVLGIYTEPPIGTEFISWIGSGDNSYSGDDFYQSMKITSPLHEQAVFSRENYSLTITSEYGDTWGGGVFPAWENTSFGIEDKYVYTDSRVRWVFIGWNSDSIYGYNGKNSEYIIELVGDISQVADWEKQYFVNISTTQGGNLSAESGWVSDYTKVHLNCTTQDGYIFTGWTGIEDSPYSNKEINQSILITSPLNVTAHWKKQFIVHIESELDADGSGVYLDGDLVKLEALESDGLIVRRVFKEWSGDISSSNNPFVFNISKDIEVSTVYEKNYTVFLGILGTIIVLVGLFFYRLIKK